MLVGRCLHANEAAIDRFPVELRSKGMSLGISQRLPEQYEGSREISRFRTSAMAQTNFVSARIDGRMRCPVRRGAAAKQRSQNEQTGMNPRHAEPPSRFGRRTFALAQQTAQKRNRHPPLRRQRGLVEPIQ